MASYSPEGKAHRVLARLAAGDASFTEIAEALGMPSRNVKRDRLWHICGALLHDRLIGGVRARYWITGDGRDALEALGRGYEAVTPNRTSVRIFA